MRRARFNCIASDSGDERESHDWRLPAAIASVHRNGDAGQGGGEFHADFRSAKLKDDAVGVLQLDTAGASGQRATGPGSAIAAGDVAGTAQIQCATDKLGGRGTNGGAEARARDLEGVIPATECKHALAAAYTDDEPRLGKHDAHRSGFRL